MHLTEKPLRGTIVNNSICISITHESQVGYARRSAVSLAQNSGFTETEAGQVAIIVSEVARNQLRYAKEGNVLLRRLVPTATEGDGIEILALDRGPGIADLSNSLRDGYSTGGTSGTGLGAVKRLSGNFDIFSQPGHGTAILAQYRVTPKSNRIPSPISDSSLCLGAVNLPMQGETACGDAWAHALKGEIEVFMVCDGLGHGPLAALAAEAAVDSFEGVMSGIYTSPTQIIEKAHRAMLSTRGAAMAVAELDKVRRTIRFAGIGNIGASIYSLQEEKKLASHNGIVGGAMRKVSEFSFAWPEHSLLVMHSDGLQTQWSISRFPGLFARHPSLIAGVLYRDFNRGRDDSTVLVVGQA